MIYASVVQEQDARMTPVRCGAGQDLESRGATPRSWHHSEARKANGGFKAALHGLGPLSKKTGSALGVHPDAPIFWHRDSVRRQPAGTAVSVGLFGLGSCAEALTQGQRRRTGRAPGSAADLSWTVK